MKNVTRTVEEDLLKKARSKAIAQHKSLNVLFREWVKQYVGVREGWSAVYQALMKRLGHARAGRCFSRDEMNER
ncbi:MAG: hypothetical protein HYY38_08935 [Rhodospirillales bacterium]|nr:hypothetical protein [Rhodospirillales bacterium]